MSSNSADEKWKTVGRMLHKTHDYISRLRDIKLRKMGLTPIRIGVLATLMESSKPVTIAGIAARIARELHTVTELLTRMQKDGLITKVRRKGMSALYVIEATDKGRQAYRQAIKIDMEKEIISALSLKEQENLGTYLEKLRLRSLAELRKHIGIPFE